MKIAKKRKRIAAQRRPDRNGYEVWHIPPRGKTVRKTKWRQVT